MKYATCLLPEEGDGASANKDAVHMAFSPAASPHPHTIAHPIKLATTRILIFYRSPVSAAGAPLAPRRTAGVTGTAAHGFAADDSKAACDTAASPSGAGTGVSALPGLAC